jgi:hypothetical protein
MSRRPALRAVLILPAALALLTGLAAGLNLLGVWSPIRSSRWADAHGLLMVLGFVGALVALERAVALGRGWAFVAPVALSLGALSHLVTDRVGAPLLLLGAVATVAIYVPLWRRQRDDAVLVQAGAAVFAVGATILWAGGAETSQLLPWLASFLVLTIVGERLELARLGMSSHAAPTLLALSLGVAVSVVAVLMWPGVGQRLLGAAFLGLAAWLVAHDVARRTIRQPGAPRFMASCLLSAQLWLGVAGFTLLAAADAAEGAAYDAVVHAVFLGFTMSMVFAHAPVILPAVTRLSLPFHVGMYLPWILLQASLLLRVGAGDLFGHQRAWEVGGVGNVIALLLFLLITVGTAVAAALGRPVAQGALR